jgi:hypothetical protein
MCECAGKTPVCRMKVIVGIFSPTTDHDLRERFEFERICWDPKDGELCLGRLKSGESLMEDRRDTDVQIVLQTLA